MQIPDKGIDLKFECNENLIKANCKLFGNKIHTNDYKCNFKIGYHILFAM